MFPDKSTKTVSIALGFTDHNLIAIKRKTKLPKAPSLIIHKRYFKHFNEARFIDELKHVNWETVCLEEDPEAALSTFMRLLSPVRKTTVRANGAPWIGIELKALMKQRNQAKKLADSPGLLSDTLIYRKLRNRVTKINRSTKKVHYKNKINDSRNDGKQLWNIFTQIMGRSTTCQNSFIEVDGAYLTKPKEIATYFNNYFTNKVENLRGNMMPSDGSSTCILIENHIMKGKSCQFDFCTSEYF